MSTKERDASWNGFRRYRLTRLFRLRGSYRHERVIIPAGSWTVNQPKRPCYYRLDP